MFLITNPYKNSQENFETLAIGKQHIKMQIHYSQFNIKGENHESSFKKTLPLSKTQLETP